MIQSIRRTFKKWFSFKFKHPAVNQTLNTAIDDKIARRVKEQEAETKIHTDALNVILRTYFAKKYESPEMMKVAFDTCNKEWLALVRKVNGSSKLINLKKDAFANQVKLVITKIKGKVTRSRSW